MKGNLAIIPKLAFLGATLATLQACAPAAITHESNLTAAYETSGLINVPPYTRTIFSTHDF